MIDSLTAIVDSTEYTIAPVGQAGAGVWLEDLDELGMAPLHRLAERGPLQHGDSDIGFRLDPRFLALVLGFREAGMSAERKTLLDIFKPRTSNVPVKLRFGLDNGTTRQIDGHYFGKMAMGSKQRLGLYQQVGVVLRCADPLYYDPTQHVVSYALASDSGGFTVPMPVPFSVGGSLLSADSPLTYAGDFIEYPVIVMQGPLSSPVLTQVTTGEVLDFTGAAIAAGDAWTIDCRYGYKTVIDGAGNNQIAALVDGSDLATFHLECDPDAPGGVNEITLGAADVTSASQVSIFYYDRFIGI